MATPPEDVVASGPFGQTQPVRPRRGAWLHLSLEQFEARPVRPPPLRLMTIGGSGQASIALK